MSTVMPSPRRQNGAALLVTMILLVLMAIFGIAGSIVTSTEEKMSSNTRDRDLALQAAEAGLRDAEVRLTDSAFRGLATTIDPSAPNDFSHWKAYDWANNSVAINQTVNQVAEQPRIVVERRGATNYFRITARGVGSTSSSVTILQAEFLYTP